MNKDKSVLRSESIYLVYFGLVATLFTFSCVSRTTQSQQKATFEPKGIPSDWGLGAGTVAGQQSVEAGLANIAGNRLLLAVEMPSLLGLEKTTSIDGNTAIALKFEESDIQPFGDGQTNSSVQWPGWTDGTKTLPFVAIFTQLENSKEKFKALTLEFSPVYLESVNLNPTKASIEVTDDQGNTQSFEMAFAPEAKVWRATLLGKNSGVSIGTSLELGKIHALPVFIDQKLSTKDWVQIRVRGISNDKFENKYFPALFRFPSQPTQNALDQLDAAHKSFSTGRAIGDTPFLFGTEAGATWSDQIESWSAKATSDTKYSGKNEGVHHEHQQPGQPLTKRRTATGGVFTSIPRETPGGTEVLYTCFDARDAANEAKFGVPSGAGWHSIGGGTNAETVITNFENSGIFAAWGVESPNPNVVESPFNAKDVAVFRIIRPGEAFTTLNGRQAGGGPHYHWYAVDQSQRVCTTIWKHGCQIKSDTNLSCK